MLSRDTNIKMRAIWTQSKYLKPTEKISVLYPEKYKGKTITILKALEEREMRCSRKEMRVDIQRWRKDVSKDSIKNFKGRKIAKRKLGKI